MLRFILRRTGQALVVLLAMSFVIYGLIGLMPGDPLDQMLASSPGASPAVIAHLRAIYGLDQPITTHAAAPGDGDFAMFQPGAGNPTGFDDLKVSEAAAFLRAIAGGDVAPGATVDDALAAARVLDAVARSIDERGWAEPS